MFMKKNLINLFSGIFIILIILSSCQVPSLDNSSTITDEAKIDLPQKATITTTFTENFNGTNSNWEKADGWSNGGMFNCTWRASQTYFSSGKLVLKLDNDSGNPPYKSGEYRTNDFFGYGLYEVSMKPAKNIGTVSSFFTYTGPSDGNPWDEIDIEFLGKDTNIIQFNYFTNGQGNHEHVHNLGFDASQSYHTYAFKWEPGKITWYVDGNPVHTATSNIPTTPSKIMMNLWPGIGVDSWLGKYNGNTPLYAQYDWVKFTPLSSDPGNGGSGLVSGGVYKIKSVHSNKLLDVSGVSTQNGANIHQWQNTNGNNQKWEIWQQGDGSWKIIAKHSGKLLEVAGYSNSNGGNVQQWTDVGHNYQKWNITDVGGGAYKIINKGSGKCLDVAGWSTSNGGNIHQWNYGGGNNQKWVFQKL